MIITNGLNKTLPLIIEEEFKEIKLLTEQLIEIALNEFDEQLKLDEEYDFSNHTTINSY